MYMKLLKAIEDFVVEFVNEGITSCGLDLTDLNLKEKDIKIVEKYMQDKNYSFHLALTTEDLSSNVMWVD